MSNVDTHLIIYSCWLLSIDLAKYMGQLTCQGSIGPRAENAGYRSSGAFFKFHTNSALFLARSIRSACALLRGGCTPKKKCIQRTEVLHFEAGKCRSFRLAVDHWISVGAVRSNDISSALLAWSECAELPFLFFSASAPFVVVAFNARLALARCKPNPCQMITE